MKCPEVFCQILRFVGIWRDQNSPQIFIFGTFWEHFLKGKKSIPSWDIFRTNLLYFWDILGTFFERDKIDSYHPCPHPHLRLPSTVRNIWSSKIINSRLLASFSRSSWGHFWMKEVISLGFSRKLGSMVRINGLFHLLKKWGILG